MTGGLNLALQRPKPYWVRYMPPAPLTD